MVIRSSSCMQLIMKRILFTCTIIFVASCNSKKEKIKVISEPITESVYATGSVKAFDQYEVYPNTSGTIRSVFVKENDPVSEGTVLMLLSDMVPQINTSNAILAENYANTRLNNEKLSDASNAVSLAQDKYVQDSVNMKRQQELWKQGIGSRLDLEQKELAFKSSASSLASAKLKYRDLQKQLSLTEKQSRNQVSINKSRENDLQVKSKISGKVYSVLKKEGEMASVQAPVAIIGRADSFYLELQVDEYDIIKLQIGQVVLVSMDSYRGQVFEAKITKFDPLMNERNKSFLAEAVFTKPPSQLFPNLTAEANIIIHKKDKALTIPRNYLINDSTVLTDGNKPTRVVTGLKDYQKAEIISGLKEGDEIYKP